MAYLAATDVTLSITSDPKTKFKMGRANMAYTTIAFGDGAKTYPFGGVPLPAASQFGMRDFHDLQIIDADNSGITWKYDKTNHKLKAYRRAPVIVFEETVTLTDGVGTTRWPMAWPLYASNGNQAITLLPAGLTPVTTTMAVNMHSSTPGTRATLTTLAGDTYSTVTISYITQAWSEVFENLVEAEIMTAGATTTNGITFTAGTPDLVSFIDAAPFLCGLMVGLNLNGTVSTPKPLQKGQTAAAAEYALDWTNTSPAATTMSILTSQNWDAATASIYFNYIKKPSAGFLYDRFVEEDAAASSSQVYTHAAAALDVPLLWSTPGFMPSVTVSTTSATWPIGATGMTLGSKAQWKPTLSYWQTRSLTANTWTSGTGAAATLTVKPSFIYGTEDDIDTIVPLEIPDGQILKAKTVRAIAWGK